MPLAKRVRPRRGTRRTPPGSTSYASNWLCDNVGAGDELEDRVRVLERIVTDGGYDLASKIEALRDERPLDARLKAPERQGSI